MIFNLVRRIHQSPSAVTDSWPAAINKDSSCCWQHGPSGPWQFRTRPVWSIENTTWMSAPGMVISLGRQPVGTAESKRLKIYLWAAITGKTSDVRRERLWNSKLVSALRLSQKLHLQQDDLQVCSILLPSSPYILFDVSIMWRDGLGLVISTEKTERWLAEQCHEAIVVFAAMLTLNLNTFALMPHAHYIC